MPFDGKTKEPEFTPEFYSKILHEFKDGRRWTQKYLQTGSRYCLLGMAYNIRYGEGRWSMADTDDSSIREFRETFAKSLGFKDSTELVRWNDQAGRTWEQVETLLKANGARYTPGFFKRMIVLLHTAQ